jgi:hypothetical protein
MNNVFPATLENGVITWGPNGAPPLPVNEPRAVEVVVPMRPPTVDPNKKRRLRKLFEELARRGTFDDIEDPVEWQREIRKDRPLEGREE